VINGAHVLLYSEDADADRGFLRDVLGFPSVDAGRGWLIFALPASEVAVHPSDAETGVTHAEHQLLGSALYLMCDDLDSEIQRLGSQGVHCTEVSREPWGIRTTIRLPSGGELGLYQPTHPTALGLGVAR
jgi:catechol 2,3-dioxygenase-like lactoylglutathione lyase family enzyme